MLLFVHDDFVHMHDHGSAIIVIEAYPEDYSYELGYEHRCHPPVESMQRCCTSILAKFLMH